MRLGRSGSAITAVAVMVCLAGCGGNDYYTRPAYPNDRSIDPGLAKAEKGFASSLTTGDAPGILLKRTAPPWRKQMAHFLLGYAGRPTSIIGREAGDDGTATEHLTITCSPTDIEPVDIAWGWFDDSWRAWPEYIVDSDGAVHDAPGCPTG